MTAGKDTGATVRNIQEYQLCRLSFQREGSSRAVTQVMKAAWGWGKEQTVGGENVKPQKKGQHSERRCCLGIIEQKDNFL